MARYAPLLAVTLALVAPPARASADGPLAVAVESDGTIDAALVRREIASRLDVAVVGLLDPSAGSARAILAIAVDDGGRRAVLVYQSARGRQHFETRTFARADASVVAEAAAQFVLELVAPTWELPSEVLDPFEPVRTASSGALVLPPEVIDPWEVPWSRAGRRNERGTRLDAPEPRP